ncbi:MAG TPA: L-threonylcarbamoyladenylate synthase [Candidatus Nitrosotalea sp.]|nr:L-threonylcarbamoyladenylate synthase [Candidatus Nitrosotalea sp.]
MLKVSAGGGPHPFQVNLLTADAAGIAYAAALLRGGGVVAFPTETVYGLGAAALDSRAVARIFEIKQRPHFDPLIVHVLDSAMLERVAAEFPAAARRLAQQFWPGPLTLVLPKRPKVPDLTTAGLCTVAVRMPSHPVARALLAAVGAPLAAPSANAFGHLSPTCAEHVAAGLGEGPDLILDAGPSEHGIESTVLAVEETGLVLLRPGAIEAEAIEEIAGRLLRESDRETVRSPGRLPRHYSPRTPLRLIEPALVPEQERRGAGALVLREPFAGYAATRILSAGGDLREAASRFFGALHELDALGLDRIDAQPLPRQGLGAAMMDRLSRAAALRNA